MSGPIHPYLAIHWRLESVPLASLPQCAVTLVDKLAEILSTSSNGTASSRNEIKTVWLATDYPYPVSSSGGFQESRRRSGTLKSIAPEHVEAISVLKDAFRRGGKLHGWYLTDISARLQSLNPEQRDNELGYTKLLEDEGVVGILDKIIATDADIFISGAKGCGRASSFTKQIIDARNTSMENGDGRLQNIVELFG
ncbi:hypothetical protein GLOTRDRAFT_46705 [Gloeophyllum trabeum ATCC 11539]|uniref:O-fucosyltransferase family protein n=1 Tax=Gloeophyllum trabeum (strain ATCC 11539 / FP-39264 / Madison 617) TaxID=670483 RepID=S7RE93_GLOTA|nr:uncharacterized protein GLOTRDRAFT_46705 [Gloeophyllum trabeum ATCC 11539]EPQ52510.1 hypothetical protein GLOTRDRAFT_46705 [Gloeophyllum trabeum ATCC 11539]